MADQFSLKPPLPVPLPKRTRPKSPEGRVLHDVRDFLEREGWLVVRTETGVFVGLGVAQLAAKNGDLSRLQPRHVGGSTIGGKGFPDLCAMKGGFEPLLIEVKAPGKAPDLKQRAAHDKIRAFGLVVVWTDGLAADDPDPKFSRVKQPFEPWYRRNFRE